MYSENDWVSLQIRPVGDFCNLACKYCKHGLNPTKKVLMSSKVLETLTRKFISHNKNMAVFCWHGGEPNLAGIDFFKLATKFQKRYGKDAEIINCLQSNGTTITSEFAKFYASHDFRVGISIDGKQSVHDGMRKQKGFKGTYDLAVNGLELLKKYGVNYSVISTVSKDSLPYAKETFEHLIHLGFKNISYSPVFDSPTGEYPSITCDEWLAYMQCVFSAWFDLGDDKIQIREICEIISWFNQTPWSCCNSLGTCNHWLVIDPIGNIFPCEKLGREVCFGNIITDELTEVVSSSVYRQFSLNEKDMPNECRCCQYVSFCNNGCRQMRIKGKKFNARGKYAFCRQRRELFRTVDTRFREVL